jgi:site-specific DNA recombinase
MDAFNSLLENKAEILKDYGVIINTLTDTSKLDKESTKLQSEMKEVTEILHKCVDENAHCVLDQAEYEDSKKGLIEIDEKRIEQSANHQSIMEFRLA